MVHVLAAGVAGPYYRYETGKEQMASLCADISNE